MDVGNGIYNGSRCLRPLQDADGDGDEDDVVCTTDLLNISRSVELLMAGSFAKVQFRASSGGTATVGNIPGGTNDGGEIIGSVVSKGNVFLGEQIADGNFSAPTAWTSGASAQIAAGFVTISAVAIEDLLIQDDIFVSGRVHDVSLNITTFNSGDIDILADGDVIATCVAAGPCTATGVVASGRFAISTANGFDGIIDDVSVTATTTGQTATFSGVTVASNDNTTMLTEFEVGDTIDNLTVFPGVSERQGVALATTQQRVYINVTDRFNGQMPNESTVTVESDNSAGCLLTSVGGKVVTSPTTPGLHSQVLNIGTDMSTLTSITLESGSGGGFVVVTVTTPIGNSVTSGFTCAL
jgi:hypothetical protein